ncbi:MAG: tRNA-binding protein [Acidimicrobiia bacterium]
MNRSSETTAEIKPTIAPEDFFAVDMRVGRIVAAPMAQGTRFPCRRMNIDLGPLGTRTSIGQVAMIPEKELVDSLVIVCANLGARQMGKHRSEVLILGTPHPDSPPDQAQAIPLRPAASAMPGDFVF